MEEADRLCDRVAIMDHGHILALDTPRGLKASVGADTIVQRAPRRATPTALAGASQRLSDGVRAEPGDGRGHALPQAARDGVVPRVVRAPRRAASASPTSSVSEPTLETVFITLTGKELRE